MIMLNPQPTFIVMNSLLSINYLFQKTQKVEIYIIIMLRNY